MKVLDLGAGSKVYPKLVSMTVSQVAGRAGVSPDSVRYYERAGLLPKPERTAVGYRVYDEDTAERLRFIKGAQRIGLRLRQIRELLEVRDRGLCPCGHTESVLSQRIHEIDTDMAALKEIRRELVRLRDQLPDPSACAEVGVRWPCEQAFIEASNLNGRTGGT